MREDQILIKDLLLRGIIGINDWEREKKQEMRMKIVMFGDLHRAGESDNLQHSINYRTVTKKVIKQVEGNKPYTVEALAAQIAKICLKQEGVTRVQVRVEKPGALRYARSVGVEIERKPEDFS